jgi:hypothetical protein
MLYLWRRVLRLRLQLRKGREEELEPMWLMNRMYVLRGSLRPIRVMDRVRNLFDHLYR